MRRGCWVLGLDSQQGEPWVLHPHPPIHYKAKLKLDEEVGGGVSRQTRVGDGRALDLLSHTQTTLGLKIGKWAVWAAA